MQGLCFAATAAVAPGCATVTAPVSSPQEPLSAIAPAELAREAGRRSRPACREATREQLSSGVRRPGDCDATTSRAARAVVFAHGVRFGVVDHRNVDLARVRMRVSEAVLCRGWPLPEEGRVLRLPDIDRAGCLIRPYHGEVQLNAVDHDGERHRIATLTADRDGYVGFDFAAADAALRDVGLEGLDGARWLEVGHSAWAGTVDLGRLRGFLADWHFAWVSSGRGSAALWAKRHEAHPRHPDAEAFAVEARVRRQQRDYDAVTEGDVPPSYFLQRHIWSPFRRAVEDIVVSGGLAAAGPSTSAGRKAAP